MAWVSPDSKIQKVLLVEGKFGTKPFDGSNCKIILSDYPPVLEKFNNCEIVIGDNYGEVGRALDICLMTMHEGEAAKFSIKLKTENISVTIELVQLIFKGFIYEWSAKTKYDMSLHHKIKGIDYFNSKNTKEAAYGFVKALKVISSIPLDVQDSQQLIEDVQIEEINHLKSQLYNNLSSCYFRNQCWPMVIDLCKKVFNFDNDNVKALYKIGIAYKSEGNFDEAEKAFSKLLEIEPTNKAATDNLNIVKAQLKQAENYYNVLVKKMFSNM